MQEPLPFPRRKVVKLEPRPLSSDIRAQLVASCPRPYRETLDVVLGIAYRTGYLFAAEATIIADVGLSRPSWYRHLAYLVKQGYLIPHRPPARHRRGEPTTAAYRVARPAERRPIADQAPVSCPCGSGCKPLASCPEWPRQIRLAQ